MKEIFFKAIRLDTCEWTYGYYDATMYKDIEVIHTDNGTHRVEGFTLGQYTGCNDRNDQKIFEGDIVRCVKKSSGEKIVGQVSFYRGGFVVWYRSCTTSIPMSELIDNYDIEVVGNVHEQNGEDNQ